MNVKRQRPLASLVDGETGRGDKIEDDLPSSEGGPVADQRLAAARNNNYCYRCSTRGLLLVSFN